MNSHEYEKLISFTYDGKSILGVLHNAKNETDRLAIIVPGIPGDRVDARRINVSIARILANRGISCLRVDLLGSGVSDGEYYNVSYADICAQLKTVIDQILNMKGISYISLIGFSEAGKISLHMLQNSRYISEVILCNGILDGCETQDTVNFKRAWKRENEFVADLGYGVWINVKLLSEKCEYDLQELSQSKRIIGIYGTGDDLTTSSRRKLIDSGIIVYDIPNADHLFTRKIWENQLVDVIANSIGME